jgi:amidase
LTYNPQFHITLFPKKGILIIFFTDNPPQKSIFSEDIPMDDLIYRSTGDLAQMIRDREVSSEEVVRAHLAWIEAVNPALNAVVHLVAEQAMSQARDADSALARGELKGPLHGVPMTLKDSWDTSGVVSTGGTKGRTNFIPKEDATVVARLKAAGAILMGKTNTSELTLSFETVNLVYGRTHNPYDLSRSPGGSSGGAAAIVASGGSPFDIGSDYAGSVRLPANFCGIAGIKPTSGRVPRTGHITPYALGATDAYQQIGPLARTVADLGLLMPIIAGPDWQDPAIVPMPWNDPATVDMKRLRVVFFTDNGAATPTPEIIQTVKDVALTLEDHVQMVEEKRPARLEETWSLWLGLHGADGGKGVLEILQQAGTDETSPNIRKVPPEATASGEEFGRRIREMDHFRSQMLQFMADYDVMICPVNANVAIPSGTLPDHFEGYSYTATHNLTGWPGAVVRAGTSPEGLPIGVQIVAPPWREDVALAVAQFVETTFGGWQSPAM